MKVIKVILITFVLFLSSCKSENEPSKEQQLMNDYLAKVESLINEQTNFSLYTNVTVRLYEDADSATHQEHSLSITEKFDIEDNYYEMSYYQKLGYNANLEFTQAYRIVDDYMVEFDLQGEHSYIENIDPFKGNFYDDTMENLDIWVQLSETSTLTTDDSGNLIAEQKIIDVLEEEDIKEIIQLGLSRYELSQYNYQFIFNFDEVKKEFSITIKGEQIPLDDSDFHHSDLIITMHFFDMGTTLTPESIAYYDGTVGSSQETVLYDTKISEEFQYQYDNYDLYKVKIEESEAGIYQYVLLNGTAKPLISKVDNPLFSPLWINNYAVYLEAGEYYLNINPNQHFTFIKEAYTKHDDFLITDSTSIDFLPQGTYDFTMLTFQFDDEKYYAKIKSDHEIQVYNTLSSYPHLELEKGNDGFYYQGEGTIYIMSKNQNKINLDIEYLPIHNKEEASLITNEYGAYYYTHNRHNAVYTYHLLNVEETKTYRIWLEALNDRQTPNLIIMDQEGKQIKTVYAGDEFELDPGLYYIHPLSYDSFFYRIKTY
jgi:hypothetical protein